MDKKTRQYNVLRKQSRQPDEHQKHRETDKRTNTDR